MLQYVKLKYFQLHTWTTEQCWVQWGLEILQHVSSKELVDCIHSERSKGMNTQSWCKHREQNLFLPKLNRTVLFFQTLDWTSTPLGVGFGQSLSVWQPWTDRKGLQSRKMVVPKYFYLESSRENFHLYKKQLDHSEVRNSAEFLFQNEWQVVNIKIILIFRITLVPEDDSEVDCLPLSSKAWVTWIGWTLSETILLVMGS